uniref:Uncharacterized protein n=1 Tax=Octopus bimaculoides TaxID=37653 RepID=A0A0L8HRG1_OCTBM
MYFYVNICPVHIKEKNNYAHSTYTLIYIDTQLSDQFHKSEKLFRKLPKTKLCQCVCIYIYTLSATVIRPDFFIFSYVGLLIYDHYNIEIST